jgi:hypothetical protein
MHSGQTKNNDVVESLLAPSNHCRRKQHLLDKTLYESSLQIHAIPLQPSLMRPREALGFDGSHKVRPSSDHLVAVHPLARLLTFRHQRDSGYIIPEEQLPLSRALQTSGRPAIRALGLVVNPHSPSSWQPGLDSPPVSARGAHSPFQIKQRG